MADNRYIIRDGRRILLSRLDSRMYSFGRTEHSVWIDGREYGVYDPGAGVRVLPHQVAREKRRVAATLPVEDWDDGMLEDWK